MFTKNSQKKYRYLALLISAVFASTDSIPINAQPRVRVVAQVPASESTMTENKEPRQAFAGQLAIFLGHKKEVTNAVSLFCHSPKSTSNKK